MRHRSRKRRPFSRYAARRRINSVHREKSFIGFHGDSKAIEEKLEAVGDLKTQIRGLISDNEDVKLNQEELNSNMSSVTHQLAMVAEALDRLSSNNGSGRTEIFRRVSRASGHSFRKQLSCSVPHANGVPQSAPIIAPSPIKHNG
jgi:regulator of replication initiation timing